MPNPEVKPEVPEEAQAPPEAPEAPPAEEAPVTPVAPVVPPPAAPQPVFTDSLQTGALSIINSRQRLKLRRVDEEIAEADAESLRQEKALRALLDESIAARS